jgi:Tfp pilus assembly protein PilX
VSGRLRQLVGSESGFALVLALGVTIVLSMTVVTVIEATTANQRTSTQSKNRVTAYTLAEAGVTNAVDYLANHNMYNPHVLHPQNPAPSDCNNPPLMTGETVSLGNTCNAFHDTYDGGDATYWGSFDSTSGNWTIQSTGTTRNPFGGALTSRTVTAVVHVRPAVSQQNFVTAWNYVFVKDTTPGICNVQLDQSTNFSVSLYVTGNLCFKNGAYIAETDPSNPINLEVLGKIVYLSGSQKGVGNTSLSNNGQVTTAKIAGGCDTSVSGTGHTCSPPGDYFYVKAGGYTSTAPTISSPNLTNTDFQNYYQSAFLSRYSGGSCTATAPNTAPSLDTNTVPLDGASGNGSLPAAFNLTPAFNYSCVATDTAGSVMGYLAWDNTNKLLKVRGTIYIDGDVSVTQSGAYQGVTSSGSHTSGNTDGQGGQAVIYASGEFTMNNLHLCGWNTATDTPATTNGTVPVNANCDFTKWSPNTSMLMFVLHANPSFDIGGGSGCYFQGAIYALGASNLGQQCLTDGPFITGTLSVGQGVNMRPLPTIIDLPLGAPGNPNTAGVLDSFQYGAG